MMKRARLLFVWMVSFAVLANVLSPRAAMAAFSPDLVICHSVEGGAVSLPLPENAACRQHCMALAAAMLTPEPPHLAVTRLWRLAEPARPALRAPHISPRRNAAQPRGPPAANI